MKHYDDYNNQRQSVASKFLGATRESEELYKIRLTCDCARFLIAQGLAFRGHDESSTSLNKGNFSDFCAQTLFLSWLCHWKLLPLSPQRSNHSNWCLTIKVATNSL
ncbi:zinc finger MYM-type protein [Trifolium repens]|nr:zinc finger MYM-type protein [Trifolium repens]